MHDAIPVLLLGMVAALLSLQPGTELVGETLCRVAGGVVGTAAAITAGMCLLVDLSSEASKGPMHRAYARALFGEGWLALGLAGGLLMTGKHVDVARGVEAGELLGLGLACLGLAKKMHSRSYVVAQRADRLRVAVRTSKFVTERKPVDTEPVRRPPRRALTRITKLKRAFCIVAMWVAWSAGARMVAQYVWDVVLPQPRQHGHEPPFLTIPETASSAVKKMR